MRHIKKRYEGVAGRALAIALAAGGLAGGGATALAADFSFLQSQEPPTDKAASPPPPPLSVFGDTLPDPGKVTISVIPTFYDNAHTLVGTNAQTSQQVVTFYRWYWNPTVPLQIVPQEVLSKQQYVTLAYGLMKDVSLVVVGGTVERQSYLNTFYGSSNLIEYGAYSPGGDTLADASAAFVWRAYQDPVNRIKLNLGMSFGTGSNHNIGGATLQTNGTYKITEAFYGMQPGTQTFDVLPGVLYAGTIQPWSWGLSYRARLPLGPNPEGYMWGNYQELNAWFGYTWIPGLTTTFRANFNIQNQIVGADWWLAGKLQSANPLNYGGKRIEVYGGADIDGKLFGSPGFAVGLEAGVPVFQELNGPQLAKNWFAGMALRWRVGEEEEEHKPSRTGIFKGPAAASEAPPKSPWTGVHVGANAGYTTSGDSNSSFLVAGTGAGFISSLGGGGIPSNVSLTSSGFISGVQLGYDRVFYDKYLFGIETDLDAVTSGTANWAQWAGSPKTYVQAGRNVPYLGTARGRLGYLATPSILLYATGGVAWGETDLRATYFSPGNFTQQGGPALGYDDMRQGWTAGAGAEWMFLPKWSAKVESLYYDLGIANTGNIGALYVTSGHNWSSVEETRRFDGYVIRMGLNYHFGPDGPETTGVSGNGIFAGDLPSRKAGYAAPEPVSWTGSYGGLNAGARIGGDDAVTHTTYAVAPGFEPGSVLAGTYPIEFNEVGFLGGGQVGYNYQMGLGAGRKDAVFGLEADFQGMAASTNQSVANMQLSYLSKGYVFTNGGFSRSADWVGTLRGRAGLLMQPSLLTYATFGLAYGDATFKGQDSGGAITPAGALTHIGLGGSSLSDMKAGYAVGGGFEWMFLPKWSLKAEYVYYSLGKFSNSSPRFDVTLATGAVSSNTAINDAGHVDGHIIRTGVNYHFGGLAPEAVVAKY